MVQAVRVLKIETFGDRLESLALCTIFHVRENQLANHTLLKPQYGVEHQHTITLDGNASISEAP